MSPKMKIFFKNEQHFWLFFWASVFPFFRWCWIIIPLMLNMRDILAQIREPLQKDRSRGIWQLLELQGGCRRAFPHRRWVVWLSSNRLGDLRMGFRVRSFFTYFSHFSQTSCAPPSLEIFLHIPASAYSYKSFEITQMSKDSSLFV